MKIKYYIFMLSIIGIVTNLHCQIDQSNKTTTAKYSELSQENIFVHLNTSLLFSGEYLFYKVYCINARINTMSKISEIAYVELISEDHEKVFSHKISLDNGLGQGDFFVPVSVPSGNYKLIAYTQWMRNVSETNFFQADISVLNPYQGNQQSVLSNKSNDMTSAFQNGFFSENKSKSDIKNNTTTIQIELEKEEFVSREEVRFTLKSTSSNAIYGNYSVSIRKKEEIPHAELPSAMTYIKQFFGAFRQNNKTKKIRFLPEVSGELITGKVIDKKTKLPVIGMNVAISIPGKDFFFLVDETDEYGDFQFSVDIIYEKERVAFQILGDNKDAYKILLDTKKKEVVKNLTFYSLSVTEAYKKIIIDRSIANQIENGYYTTKPDTLKVVPYHKPFTYYNETVSFPLDEYTRFPTIVETFVEVIDFAWTKKATNGKTVFKVKNHDDETETDLLPLVFVDGIFIQEHETVLGLDPDNIVVIRVLRDMYEFGSKKYHGAILFETKDGDFINTVTGDFITEIVLKKPLAKKNYFRQTYSSTSEKDNRIPDYRYQLLWDPSINLIKDDMIWSCFSSDIEGIFVICVEGFTFDGKPITLQKEFIVEN